MYPDSLSRTQKRKIMQERQNQKELSEKKKCGCCGDPFADGNGATCPECNHQVCQKCQRTTEGAPGFYCTLCSKEKYVTCIGLQLVSCPDYFSLRHVVWEQDSYGREWRFVHRMDNNNEIAYFIVHS